MTMAGSLWFVIRHSGPKIQAFRERTSSSSSSKSKSLQPDFSEIASRRVRARMKTIPSASDRRTTKRVFIPRDDRIVIRHSGFVISSIRMEIS
jgi:hypothetical protein